MLSKSIEKYVNSLKQKKQRIEESRFIAEGEKIADELLQSPFHLDKIVATRDWIAGNEFLLKRKTATVVEVDENEMKRISSLSNPSRVLMIAEIPGATPDEGAVKSGLNLFLDAIQDPGNMGTIIRIADWFGIGHIFCSEDCVDAYNPKVIQATMGSITRVQVMERKPDDVFKKYPELPVYATTLHGENIFSTNLKERGFIVISNESRGLSEELLPFIHKQITIPKTGMAESLNAAVAAGIVCAAFRSRKGDYSSSTAKPMD